MRKNKVLKLTGIFFLAAIFFLLAAGKSYADINELKTKIAEREAAIKQLEMEIAATQIQIDNSQSTQKTLKNTIATLDAERRKFLKQITLTEEKISAKQLEIESLELSIGNKNRSIEKSIEGIASVLRSTNALESRTLIAIILNNKNLSDFWNSVREYEIVGIALKKHIAELKLLRENLEKDKTAAEVKRLELLSLRKQLTGQKQLAEASKAEKEKLLKETKNKESEYQKILQNQIANRDAFEKELLAYEAELKFEIDPTLLPETGQHILRWPLDIAIKITQYFGKTTFADAHPQLYNGQGHNGIDLKASIGTPIKAVLSGKVIGLGNTDTACPGASYGKWILLQHSNGLSTLYAHLSTFTAAQGDNVSLGDVIGLSGNTGYSTGPHLHFTVFATQGVRVLERKSKVCRGSYTMPVADLRAYLNPLAYL